MLKGRRRPTSVGNDDRTLFWNLATEARAADGRRRSISDELPPVTQRLELW